MGLLPAKSEGGTPRWSDNTGVAGVTGVILSDLPLSMGTESYNQPRRRLISMVWRQGQGQGRG